MGVLVSLRAVACARVRVCVCAPAQYGRINEGCTWPAAATWHGAQTKKKTAREGEESFDRPLSPTPVGASKAKLATLVLKHRRDSLGLMVKGLRLHERMCTRPGALALIDEMVWARWYRACAFNTYRACA